MPRTQKLAKLVLIVTICVGLKDL